MKQKNFFLMNWVPWCRPMFHIEGLTLAVQMFVGLKLQDLGQRIAGAHSFIHLLFEESVFFSKRIGKILQS